MDVPILTIYNPNNETELCYDANSSDFGAILVRPKKYLQLHPVMYFSKRDTSVDSKYHSFELKTLRAQNSVCPKKISCLFALFEI